MTHEFSDVSTLHVGKVPYLYFGSLRAMSAQMLQKAALADLSRVGLAVPPTVDVSAPVRVFVTKNMHNRARMVELEGVEEPRAQVFVPRGGKDVHKRLLFTPQIRARAGSQGGGSGRGRAATRSPRSLARLDRRFDKGEGGDVERWS